MNFEHETPTEALSLDDMLEQVTTPKPKTHNDVLDTPTTKNTVDLLSFVDDNHLLKKLSKEIAAAFHLPESTVFLMGLSVYSSVTCRKFVVNYPDNKYCLSLGLYSIAEQPSGVGKSRCLNVFQSPFFDIHKAIVKERNKRISRLLNDKELTGSLNENDQQELLDLQASKVPLLYTTNATPEGLEKTLSDNKGFFAAISSEQGLFNALFGKSYSNGANNNDVVLNGFDSGYINTNRAGRDGYSGNVTGAVICFAQQGSVETILDASNGTGLSERFLMLVEPHKLGTRNHKKNGQVSDLLLIEYDKACSFALDVFTTPQDYSDLSHLFISNEGFDLIAEYKNAIEPHLADGGKYSYPALRGVASKINMQIMKIAANLHLLDDGFFQPVIADKHVKSAIQIADRLLQVQLKLMRDKGIIGIKAEYRTILAVFEKKPIATTREITEAKRKVQPFVDMDNPTEAIKQCLPLMEQQGLLESFTDGKRQVYRMGQ